MQIWPAPAYTQHGTHDHAPASTRPACYGTTRPEDAPPLIICPQHAPAISTDTATTCCTRSTVSDRDGHQHEERERGRRAEAERREKVQDEKAQPHAVKVIKGRTPPAYTASAYQHRPAVALLPALDRLHPSPVQFCFWRVCRTAPHFMPDCRRETDAPRLPSIQTPGEPLHFRRPGQFYKLTQYLPSLTYPLIFTRQQPRAFLFYRRENIALPNRQNNKCTAQIYYNRLNFYRLQTIFYPKETKIHRFIVDFSLPLWYNKLRKTLIANVSFDYLNEVIL